ncbi:MAG TPA: glycine zipper 2TM domain-containing protein [Steroidobacteraceae bacterium]|nr:glycine zipper 2TM domain-containing protein [Steroidobacteraceae bacterium]
METTYHSMAGRALTGIEVTPRLGRAGRSVRVAAAALGAAMLCGCVAPPPPRPMPPPPPPINTTVYAYPLHGQTPEQLDRDRYECYVWAKNQTGFDPSAVNLPPQMRVQVVGGPPPGTGTAVGAITGAAIGAAVSNPWNRGFGMLAGALIGGAVGSTADAAQQARVQQAAAMNSAQFAQLQRQAADYRRALSACLEGRGYSVH